MQSYRLELIGSLREQASFADGYSPLYERLFSVTADWLEAEPDDPTVFWLLETVQDRAPFDVTLLLPAGLHRAVLAGEPGAADLAAYYPTAGGTVPESDSDQFAAVLRAAVAGLRNELAPFLREATVQTNETARGLVWLWPLAQTRWPEVHLLELGASAGLNLLAERRAYALISVADPDGSVLNLGEAPPRQFVVPTEGMERVVGSGVIVPRMLSRTGVDLRPFLLNTTQDELTLASYVWGDQPARLRRLREGIAALHTAEAEGTHLHLASVDMPSQLSAFLAQWVPEPQGSPLVIYNTTVSMYLDGKQQGLRDVLEAWAPHQQAPVLWLQWEPPSSLDAGEPPASGWAAWTADLWQAGRHHHYHLAWVHPHATGLHWLPGASDWVSVAQLLH